MKPRSSLVLEPVSDLSSFDDWIPRDYLSEYFSVVNEDERHVISYLVEQMRSAGTGDVLFFGCGPALSQVFLTAPYAERIVLSDYLPGNLAEIEAWRRRRPGAHDWADFVRYTLRCETGVEPSDADVERRSETARARMDQLLLADARLTDPIGGAHRGRFSTVISAFCADSATDDQREWERYSRNIATLVRPGGLMLTAALERCVRYRVGTRYFASANIDESDLRAVLAKDFAPDTIEVKCQRLSGHQEQGYSGILLARARKA